MRRMPLYSQKIILLLLLLLGLNFTACSIGSDLLLRLHLRSQQAQLSVPASESDLPIRFVVEPGTPARQIGQNLQTAGLIQDARLFEAYVRLNGLAEQMESGGFVLRPSMTLLEIVEELQHAEAASITLMIPEGWRTEQIVDYVAAAKIFGENEEELSSYRQQLSSGILSGIDINRYPFLQERPSGASLEGYLFPDTYQLPATGAMAADLLQRQLDAFVARVIPVYAAAKASGSTQLDLYTALTLASIVEREAMAPEERATIATVYLNRLAAGMKLEADPTVQYAMGYQPSTKQWWKTPIFLEEYSTVDSPYNTYLYTGLPPGPIASPGLSSIQAVLQPDNHDYLYFVALPDNSGRHVFARTFEEHSANVQRYLRGQ